jgi:hypothetical protein
MYVTSDRQLLIDGGATELPSITDGETDWTSSLTTH